MSQHIKTGHLRYYYKGLLSRKWKDFYFVLFDDSTLQWYEKQNDRKPEGSVRIRDIAKNLCVGPYTRCLPNRPPFPRPTDEANLIALPKASPGHRDPEVIWILCNDVTHLNDWMKAIVSTLPPPPQQIPPPPSQTQAGAYQPSAPPGGAPPPYSSSSGGYPPPPQQRPVYPQLPGNQPQQAYRPTYGGSTVPQGQQPSYNHTTVVVQPSPAYGGGSGGGGGYGGYRGGGGGVGGSSLAGVGLGLAGGALLGGALGYAWGGGFGGHGGWGYGMGPAGNYGGYGGWGGGNDSTVINNYYDNDTTNNYDQSTTHNDYSATNDTNNFDNGYQQPDSFQYDTNNGGGDVDYGNVTDNYGGGGDYGGGDNFGGGDDYGGGDFGGGDFGGGDFGGGDFGGGDCNAYVWQPITDVFGEERKTKRETMRRARLDKPESGLHRRQQLEKYVLAALHFTAKCKFESCKKQWTCQIQRKETEVDVLPYRNFAERMAKSTVDFKKICQEQ
ncbi:unnamed protein product [Rotaria socialis]|uniref:PH domain-containing protein n=1 Tax=Rotaria socialis TaxID=392032 RepID=A0A821L0S8_9BILA|nr:unnamed protein product [Rotaria socialis]CAF4743666.1 unnamed protein product [Rotaria socialis]